MPSTRPRAGTQRGFLTDDKLSKKEADTAEWQAAIESLMLVAQYVGPTMFAGIGIVRALNRQVR